MFHFVYFLLFEGEVLLSNLLAQGLVHGLPAFFQILRIKNLIPKEIHIDGLEQLGIRKIRVVKFLALLCYGSFVNFYPVFIGLLDPACKRLVNGFKAVVDFLLGDDEASTVALAKEPKPAQREEAKAAPKVSEQVKKKKKKKKKKSKAD